MGKTQKYIAVSSVSPDETEFEHRKSLISMKCIWGSTRTVILLLIYFVPSICLTFYQRWLLQRFHFPLSIVLCHLVVKFILSAVIRKLLELKQRNPRVTLGWTAYCKSVTATGIASGLDVGLSNWGLEFVTITLYTLTKSTTIIFILGCAILLKLEKKSWSLIVIVVMISCGLMLFTYKATQFSAFGFVLLLFASFTSGLRWTCAQLLLQKSKLGIRNPVDMIYHVQPWMMISILPFAIAIEGPAFISNCRLFRFTEWDLMLDAVLKILFGAVLAFVMEMSEFLVVTYTSSLTLSIGGIFKDVFILVLAVEWNGDQMSKTNALGLVVCLCGIISHVLYKISSTSVSRPVSYFEEVESMDMGEPLLSNTKEMSKEISSEEEMSDTQELFNILNSRDR